MKKLVIVAFAALLAACPSQNKVDDPTPTTVKVFDATPAAPMDAGVWRPIVRDKRLTVKTKPANKEIERPSSTAVQSQPIKIMNGTVGLGLIAIVKRGGKKLIPPLIYLKFVGMHKKDQSIGMSKGNRWIGCYDHKLLLDGRTITIAKDKMSGGSSSSGDDFRLEHIDFELTLYQLGAMAYAKELKMQLCKDVVTFKPEEQKVLQAMYSELQSPTLFK